jgi:hypothetical protein
MKHTFVIWAEVSRLRVPAALSQEKELSVFNEWAGCCQEPVRALLPMLGIEFRSRGRSAREIVPDSGWTDVLLRVKSFVVSTVIFSYKFKVVYVYELVQWCLHI